MGKRLIAILMFFVLLILAMAMFVSITSPETEVNYGEFVVYKGNSLLSFGVCASSVSFNEEWLSYTLPSGGDVKVNIDRVIEVEARLCSVTRAVN